MEYQLKNDSVEAWQIGSEPVPDWVAELVEDKTIRGKTDSSAFSIATDDGPQNANAGDYIAYHPTVWGEPTPDAPQGEILAFRSVKLIAKGEFEKLYDVPLAGIQKDVEQPTAADDSQKPKRKRSSE